ncbi:MAG: hypothetical protein ACLUFI_14820 [Oscillospiraceae bacterium]
MKTQAFCRILWYNVCMENREMQTSNTAEMVTISRAEYEQLSRKCAVGSKKRQVGRGAYRLSSLLPANRNRHRSSLSLTLQNEWLLEQLKLSKKKLFGRSSGAGGADGHGATELYLCTGWNRNSIVRA